jgi:hypothetical protein
MGKVGEPHLIDPNLKSFEETVTNR